MNERMYRTKNEILEFLDEKIDRSMGNGYCFKLTLTNNEIIDTKGKTVECIKDSSAIIESIKIGKEKEIKVEDIECLEDYADYDFVFRSGSF